MKLKTLSLRNFKGIKELTLDADGNNVNIYGANESGKTTVNDAFAWIITGKDSLDRKDFGIKPIGSSGIDCEVEAVLLIDGKEVTFRKVYKETWTKKRGSAQSEFTGHTTDHYINGVPKQQKEYQSVINTIIGEEQFKLLTSPRYFNESLDWRKRRELLMTMCGVTGGELKEIGDRLKVLKANQTELNKALRDIPVRIDEANRALPAKPDISPDSLWIERLRQNLSTLQEKKAGINAGGGGAEIKEQIAAVDTELLQIKNQHSRKVQDQINKVRQDKKVIDDQIGDIETKISSKRRQTASAIQEEKELKDALAKLRDQYLKKQEERSKVEAEEYKGDSTCFNCKQPLPDDMVESATAAFNRLKSEKLERLTAELAEIDKKGKASRDRLEELASQGNSATEGINSLNQELTALQGDERTLKILIDQLNSMVGQAEGLPEYEEVLKKKAPLQQKLVALQQDNSGSLTEVNQEISAIQSEIDKALKIEAAIKQRAQGQTRIADLKDEEKKLASQYEDKERGVFETETQLRETVKALEESINSKFETISFKLFNTLINGGIEDCCEASSKTGVPYRDMSNSQKIRAGLEIIRTMSRHYGVECCVWIDNAESCDHLVPMNCQVIQLIVLQPRTKRIYDGKDPEGNPMYHEEIIEDDKTLRVEKAEIKEEVLV